MSTAAEFGDLEDLAIFLKTQATVKAFNEWLENTTDVKLSKAPKGILLHINIVFDESESRRLTFPFSEDDFFGSIEQLEILKERKKT